MAVVAIIAGFIPINASANETFNSGQDAQLIYQTRSANHSIYSYLSNLIGKVSVSPELIYVNQAYGPAIHSYAHSGNEIVASWNVEYIDTANGQAIHSYSYNK